MMNYITSILRFLEHSPSWIRGPVLPDIERNPPHLVSCRGWSRPDPAVHLRLSNNKIVRIFGYPREEDLPPEMDIPFVNMGNGGSPLLYLRGDIPAYVSHIMGEDWRSKLRGDHHTNSAHLFHDGEVILRPSATTAAPQMSRDDLEASERAHCLRMRRCGAVAVRSEVDVNFEETAEDRRPDHLFGWPANGRVWILRSHPIRYLREDPVLWTIIKQQSNMEEFCHVLKEAGGHFYSNITDCPEVVELGLLN